MDDLNTASPLLPKTPDSDVYPASTKAFLAFSQFKNFGPRTILRLIEHFSSIELALNATTEQINEELPEKLQEAVTALQNPQHENWQKAEQEIERCQDLGITLLDIESADYPPLLKEISSPPIVMYMLGNTALLKQRQVAIVGARKVSQQGLQQTADFAHSLSQAGFSICSGLAEGVDGQAHQSALKAGGSTVAVVAHGLDRIYPKRHKGLFEQMIRSGQGLIISEFALGTQPLREYFPRRNRIISGLSEALLVSEAAIRSGTLITARFAIEQNRDVFAIPGNIQNPNAQGCNYLIQEGAYLASSPEYMLETLQISQGGFEQNDLFEEPAQDLTEAEAKLLNCCEYNWLSFDSLYQKSLMAIGELNAALVNLEYKGMIEHAMGRYKRIV